MTRIPPLSEQAALDFFSKLYRGVHHMPSKLKHEHGEWSVRHYLDLATFDYDELTRLVFIAHDFGVRASVKASGPRHLRISITPRLRGFEPDIALVHPTLEEAVDKFRARDGAQWTHIMSEKRLQAKAGEP